MNFASNENLSPVLTQKLIESKCIIVNELVSHIQKFDLISKKSFAWTLKLAGSLGQHKEIRVIFMRSKLIEALNKKFENSKILKFYK